MQIQVDPENDLYFAASQSEQLVLALFKHF